MIQIIEKMRNNKKKVKINKMYTKHNDEVF
jgi:hypothetical protein